MNNGSLARLILCAVAAGSCATGAFAAGKPKPSISVEPVTARNLLAPVEPQLRPQGRSLFAGIEKEGLAEDHSYRVGNLGEQAVGKRAKLSVAVGDTTVFAITGKLARAPQAGPADPRLNGLSSRKDSGKVYGAGVERRVGPVDLSATYQFSKVTAEHPDIDGAASISSGGRSHSLRATARIRFRN